MKAIRATKFCWQVAREAKARTPKHLLEAGRQNDLFYFKLGIEAAMTALASTVGANNIEPNAGPKWYLHSPKQPKKR